MGITQDILAICFWTCVGAVAYAYLAYPILIFVLSRLCGRTPARPAMPASSGQGDPESLPSVDLLIAAHNEADVIGARISNALALTYPVEKRSIVIASDASDDGTETICERYSDRVRLLHSAQRRGKTGTINAAWPHLTGDVVVCSDANTFMDPESLHNLARWFQDPDVGVVCGRLILTDARTGRNADSVYWRYETFLKRCEARLGALLGANGAIYAIRRSLLPSIPDSVLVDDFVIPLLARIRSGCRIVYDPDAIAREETAPDMSSEFRRRARIGTGGFQALGVLKPLLHPRWGWTSLALWSHKVLRWIGPVFLAGALLTSVLLARQPLYLVMAVAQGVFYAMSALVAVLPGSTGPMRLLRVLPMFVGMNLALFVGLWRWIRGRQTGVWTRTPRAAGPSPAPSPH